MKISSEKNIDPVDRLIIALDVPTLVDAREIIADLGDSVSFYKIGFQLVLAGGLTLVEELKAEGKKVFLDMKLLDIDNTIAKGVENAVGHGVDMLTIHAYPKAMRSAVDAAKGTSVCLLGVTVLTSMDDDDLAAAGYAFSADQLVRRRAKDAQAAGMGGVVASAKEARDIRKLIGPEMALVTPGIRPAGAAMGDQKRVVTPGDAIAAGASHLVVGRPVVAAADRKRTAMEILNEISTALA